MVSVPKPKKKRKSKQQKKVEDSFSGFWLNKADKALKILFHNFYSDGVCAVGKVGGYDECKNQNISVYNVECAHLIPVENKLYRFDLRNVVPLCSNHHRFSRVISSHYNPAAFYLFLEEHYPDKWKFLQENRNVITRKAELPFTYKEKYFQLLFDIHSHGADITEIERNKKVLEEFSGWAEIECKI
jgi:hypothetical protein